MADLGAAIIAGSIGLVSAGLSYAMAQRQLARGEREAIANRRHALALLALTRRLDSIELLWLQAFQIEQGSSLPDSEVDGYIRATVWLPANLRTKAINVLRSYSALTDRRDIPPQLVTELGSLRTELSAAAELFEQ